MERVASNTSLGKILEWCALQHASDLHAQADHRYAYRVDGKLMRLPPEQFPAPPHEQVLQILREAFSAPTFEQIEKQRETDLSFLCGKQHYRANIFKQQGRQCFSFRAVPRKIPKLEDLELPASVGNLVQEPRGLLLVAGSTGQGKSTTCCALLQRLNETAARRIITIEDPIEYVFEENQCQFVQREVGVDTDSYYTGIRSVLRQDPEVIFIGEIRDRDSIQAAMHASETGHLVLATFHADSAAQVIERIREFHPAAEQDNANALLARSLNAILVQRLIPSTFNKRIPCLELMKRNIGIVDAIAHNDLRLLTGHIEAAVHEGMHTFDQYLMQLLKSDYVTVDTARHFAVNWSRMEMELNGFVPLSNGILKPDHGR